MRADVGEARGIGHARGLAGFGVSPVLALLEFDGVIVEQLIDGHGWEHQGMRLVTRPWHLATICTGRPKGRPYAGVLGRGL